MSDRRVLITGATGFLGGALARHLAACGNRVTATGRDAEKCDALRAEGFTTYVLDLADPGFDPTVLFGNGHDAVIHCAALSSPWGPRHLFNAANVDATRRLLQAARTRGCGHFIFMSSPSVYFRPRDQFGLREDIALPPPVNAYAWSKGLAETLVREEIGLPTTILRPRALYGRGDTALLPRLAAACARGPLPLVNGGRAATDPTHVDDAVAAIEAVIRAGPSTISRTFNISGGVALSIRHIVEATARRSGLVPRWRRVPWPVLSAAVGLSEYARLLGRADKEPAVTRYAAGIFAFSQTHDISHVAEATGWRPRISFEDGLDRTFT